MTWAWWVTRLGTRWRSSLKDCSIMRQKALRNFRTRWCLRFQEIQANESYKAWDCELFLIWGTVFFVLFFSSNTERFSNCCCKEDDKEYIFGSRPVVWVNYPGLLCCFNLFSFLMLWSSIFYQNVSKQKKDFILIFNFLFCTFAIYYCICVGDCKIIVFGFCFLPGSTSCSVFLILANLL